MANRSYEDITNKIDDLIGDDNFTNSRGEETLRAINDALDRINSGDLGEDKGMSREVAYDFQKKIASVTFVNTTTDYDFSTLSITDYKFANDLRINSDENVKFIERDANYFFRKKGVFASNEYMYAITWEDSTQKLMINYDTSDTLDFEYFSNIMVEDESASTYSSSFDGTTDDTLLIPDHLWLVVPYLAAADLSAQRLLDRSNQPSNLERKGLQKMKLLIDSIGVTKKIPSVAVKTRSEWWSPLNRIGNN